MAPAAQSGAKKQKKKWSKGKGKRSVEPTGFLAVPDAPKRLHFATDSDG